MSEIITNDSMCDNTDEKKIKVIALFNFINDFCSLKTRVITDIKNHNYICYFKDIPEDVENITLIYRDRVEEESTTDDTILKLKKPEFQVCPKPPDDIVDWLVPGWEKFRNSANCKRTLTEESIPKVEESSISTISNNNFFEESEKRIKQYEKWIAIRNIWVEKQKVIEKTRRFFVSLYNIYTDLEKDSETIEFIVGNGFINDTTDQLINHPILLKRVRITFDAQNNIIYIRDTNTEAELFTMFLQQIKYIKYDVIKRLKDELREFDYHPLDRYDAYDYLKSLIHSLCSEGSYFEPGSEVIPDSNDKLILTINPVFFIRKRLDGTAKVIDEIINNIEKTGYIPAHIMDLVAPSNEKKSEDNREPSIDEQLAASSGENFEILLPKEANREQLEIAKRIERYNAVLVQGPPGTGKTHTIANLLSHFLAKGNTVLVTSHTKKALTVLKEKIPKGIQNLCVSVLDDSNRDMEQSVDGISSNLAIPVSDYKKKMETSARLRNEIMKRQADIRRKIFSIKYKEFEPIVYNGDSYSPAQAAVFVRENAEELSHLIPGKVELYKPLPLTIEELYQLYRSNDIITSNDEIELNCELPDPSTIINPAIFENGVKEFDYTKLILSEESKELQGVIEFNYNSKIITLNNGIEIIKIASNPNSNCILKTEKYITSFNMKDEWMVYAVIDGKKGGGYKKRWELMISCIEATIQQSDSLVIDLIDKKINIKNDIDIIDFEAIINEMELIYLNKGKISFFDRLRNAQFDTVEKNILINDSPINNLENCNLIKRYIQLLKMRANASLHWNKLMAQHGIPCFFDLSESEPERIASNMISLIQHCLTWYSTEYDYLNKLMSDAEINIKQIFMFNNLDSDVDVIKKIFYNIKNVIPNYLKLVKQFIATDYYNGLLNDTVLKLTQVGIAKSTICASLISAIQNKDTEKYFRIYQIYVKLYEKYKIREIRENFLGMIFKIAPEWANAIQNRIGIHGEINVTSKIVDAWKWKQLSGILDDITKEPFGKLQTDNIWCSSKYREVTAEFAEYSAWYNLLIKIDTEMQQALQGWRLAVRQIGKGTGKNAPMLKAIARKLMVKCQEAVPAWIMPVNKALESLNPSVNNFDIIIVDEASQSDISALAIIYMAKKVIIVGDDKQVSPSTIGIDIDRVNALASMHIQDKIRNWQAYNVKSSLYDIAKTTFTPLMLREHFRCVPDIIGFSNKYSYDYGIKPLRDISNCELLPAVVNYRVDGQRNDKINRKEADTIISLLSACLEQEEYADKTFGIISLLGDDQSNIIQRLIFEKIDPIIINKHRILCGNATHFQGDERDVIFLSVVDSNDQEGPLHMVNEGPDESTKKRYNVAASRAKDQMWVIHSLDSSRDLQSGDLRKELIDYATDPSAYSNMAAKIEVNAESPFEESVGKALVARGYNLVQQWKVGAYRIDMVVVSGNKKIAIECDGDRYHVGEDKIREDMERQTILERLGWKFIRIRGSEYYRNPEKTIDRIVIRLEENGIKLAETESTISKETTTSELLSRVKIRSMQIIDEWKKEADKDGNTIIKKESEITIPLKVDNNVKRIQPLSTVEHNKKNEKPEKVFIQQTMFDDESQKATIDFNDSSNKKESLLAESIPIVEKSNNESKVIINKQQQSNNNAQPQTIVKGTTHNSNADIYKNVIRILKETKVEYIDNFEQSLMIWVIYSEKSKTIIQNIQKELSLDCILEKRGSEATNKRAAYRIMKKKER